MLGNAAAAVEMRDRTTRAEQVLLGAMMYPDTSRPKTAPRLGDGDFQERLHSAINRTIWRLRDEGMSSDPSLVATLIERDLDFATAGGLRYLVDLIKAAPLIGDETDCARSVRSLASKRALFAAAAELQALALEPDLTTTDAIERVRSRLDRLAVGDVPAGKTLREVARLEAAALRKPLACLSTGIPALDDVMLGGIYPGKLYGIAARMKTGKTLALGTIASNMALAGRRVLFVAAEMGQAEIAQRTIARGLGRNAGTFLRRPSGDLPERVERWAEESSWADNLWFEDRPGIAEGDLRRLVSSYRHEHGIEVAIVDYWQLIGGQDTGETEVKHLSDVAQTMANDAKAAGDFAYLTAAQINREGHTRGGDGLRLACSMYLHMQSTVRPDGVTELWMDMEDTRYTPRKPVGDKDHRLLFIDRIGPHVAQSGVDSPGMGWAP